VNRQIAKHSIFLSLSLALLAATPLTYAAGGKNDTTKFFLDFNTGIDDTQTSSVIDAYSPDQIQEIDGKRYITVTLVLKGATDLVGVNCDLSFDKNKLQVVDIHEDKGDINFDGRANIADVLTLGERFGAPANEQGFSYFDRDQSGVIDQADVEDIQSHLNKTNIFWTSNPNTNQDIMRESVEIFEDPAKSNEDGVIDDIVAVLLSRIHPYPAGFGFNGDARIAEITFEVIGSGTAEFTFSDGKAIDVDTQITVDGIANGSEPTGDKVEILLP